MTQSIERVDHAIPKEEAVFDSRCVPSVSKARTTSLGS